MVGLFTIPKFYCIYGNVNFFDVEFEKWAGGMEKSPIRRVQTEFESNTSSKNTSSTIKTY